MLDSVIDLLACPQCESALDLDDTAVLCERGHSFDIARQGYVSLLTGAATRFTGDTAEMIADRAAFLGAGHYDPIRDAVTAACASVPSDSGVLEVGAGTGQYLASVLDGMPGARGIGLDVSKPAVRRIARSHPRAGAVLADAWAQIPVRSGMLGHVLSVFAPRNASEVHRVLEPGGALVVATPTPEHLRELVSLPGMVSVDEHKTERLSAALSGLFERHDRTEIRFAMELTRQALDALVGMGPSAFHLTTQQRAEMLEVLPGGFEVTASVTVSTWVRRPGDRVRRDDAVSGD
ncbi:23S rRNA (guanine745-N1)-methyltransferase [Rhodococcus sp. SMB37]|uniref:putative RNA methyltransferase n=1 Tax=Rhodococcus sp. SMB37 TaxID=2512213 RepID=UPI0006D080FF|nr:methyltransferase domain-containing protein [Rhodococcus sp. SMB37]TCN55060.1 23S rRNA (guanine745-N1)-methyltransferase [Rhodococcus sp. SMB37]